MIPKYMLLAAASLASTTAHAQTAAKADPAATPAAAPAAAPAPVDTSGVQEIVVTAEKRSNTVQRTPIALTVLTPARLADQHIQEAIDLGTIVPNLQIVPIAQTIQVNIRGVGSNFFDPRGESSIAQSIDGLYYARPPQAGATFFDLSRIEVLKGPQGTLYGTNAVGGAVNLVTNAPADHFEADAELGIGNYARREYAGMINIPVTDDLAVRVAGRGLYHDGYIAGYYDDSADNAFRVSAKWRPSGKLTAYAAYNFSDFDGHGSTPVSYPCDSTPYSNTISPACAPPGNPGGTYQLTGHTHTRLETLQLNLDYDFGFATLTSITGYMTQSIHGTDVPNGTFFISQTDQRSHDVSQELRLAGADNARHAGGLSWVVGGYLSNGNGYQRFDALGPPTILTRLPETVFAGFGQATYAITDHVRVTGGVRYTHDDKGVTDAYGTDIDVKKSHVNYRAAVETDLDRDKLLYASVSSGYVAGGANGGDPAITLAPGVIPTVFFPETITAVEVGSKNSFVSGRLRLNAAAYYYSIKNYQSYDPGFINTGFGPVLEIQNIADATTYGGEIEGEFALTPDDRFTFSASLAHGSFGPITLDTFTAAPGAGLVPIRTSVPGGYPLTNLPERDIRLGYNHIFHVGAKDTITAGVNTHLSGSYWTVPASTDPLDRQGSFSMTDLNLRFALAHRFSIEAWVKNVENVAVTTYGENPGFHLYYPAPPRTFGGTLHVTFR